MARLFTCIILCPGDCPYKGENRVLRGGSWINNGRNVRSAYRNFNDPGNRNFNIGFRLARAQDSAGWLCLTRRSSCPRLRGKNHMARGM